jgi:ABC-type dipeptide/oligopeptide/nickel transport system permease subunit
MPWIWIITWFGVAASSQIFAYPKMVLELTLAPPTWLHFCGCDAFGRDMLSIVLRAALASSVVSFVATAIASACALALGGGIALLPERPRFAALRALETCLAFPFLLIALGLAAVRGPGWSTLLFSLLIGLVPSFTRLIQARSREILAEPFIEAAGSLGVRPLRILTHHVVPNLTPLVWAKAPLLFAQCLMAEAALSFLGVGAPSGSETWGSLLASGKDYLLEAPHIALTAGIPLVLTVLALQSLSVGKNPELR